MRRLARESRKGRGAHIEHGAAEKVALEMKAEAKDYKLKFLERENARLRRLVPRA